jgi:formate hydrogenlyase transcriptional activator
LERYKLLGDVFANALMRKRSDKALQQAFREIKILKEQLEAENVYLRQQVRLFRHYEDIIGESPAIQQVLRLVEQVAETDSTVLIQGETGTGKELVADAVHRLSKRRERVMVKVNCAAIPQTLIESELFGREKGAFTGASSREIGRFETAHRGTILLDEVGDLPFQLQSKLLRVLQDGTFERLGSSKTVKVDVRVVASTNKDLKQAVQDGAFRPDLYYRLNVFTITVPPLRDRKEDIPALIWWFVSKYAKKMNKKIETIPRQAMAAYQQYNWPGNVRELMNAVERSVILTQGTVLNAYIPIDTSATPRQVLPWAEMERKHMLEALEITRWRVRGQGGAAEILGLKPTTLESRMAKLGIRRPKMTPKYRMTKSEIS